MKTPKKPGVKVIPVTLPLEQIEKLDAYAFRQATNREEASRSYFIGKWIDAGCPIDLKFGPRRTVPKDHSSEETKALYLKEDAPGPQPATECCAPVTEAAGPQ